MTQAQLIDMKMDNLRPMYREKTGHRGVPVLKLTKEQLIAGIMSGIKQEVGESAVSHAKESNSIGMSEQLSKPADKEAMPTQQENVQAQVQDQVAEAIAKALAPIMSAFGGQKEVDEEAVNALIDKRTETLMQAVESTFGDLSKALMERFDKRIAALTLPRKVEITTASTGKVKNVGIQHEMFETLVLTCNARDNDGKHLNIWLKGPAGTGKTTAARKIAEAYDRPFHFNGPVDSEYKLFGYISPKTGELVRTPFREAWEHGGIYLFDECDGSNPKALLAFNAALANGVAPFPDGSIQKHDNCVIIAGANSSGLGGSSTYNARQKMDGAFMDRFVEIEWEVDEKLESALCENKEWFSRVKAVRAKVKERGVKNITISPRATFYGEALLRAGLKQKQVEKMTLKKGMTDEQWKEVA